VRFLPLGGFVYDFALPHDLASPRPVERGPDRARAPHSSGR
jgi:hypothetical protein